MGRAESQCIDGDFWLDKRRDGKAPDIWQIATYSPTARSIVYRSTRERSLDAAKAALHAHAAKERAKGRQDADAQVIPLLFAFWDEHGRHVVSPAQIASSIRQFIGFLMHENAENVTVAELNPQLFRRFAAWRMGPHEYEVPWRGKFMAHKSPGVRGESAQRNLDDIRAALNHHADNGRIPYAPKVPSVETRHRSQPRDRVLTTAELGAILGYSFYDPGMMRFVCLMLATMARPVAAGKMNPSAQYDAERELIDLHPPGDPRTKKHNPVLPVIPEFRPILAAWEPSPAKSRKTRWRTMRAALGLPADVVPKTIRHTVATRLRTLGAPGEQIETMLGHKVLKRTSAVYAKYDPAYLSESAALLSIVWREAMAAAWSWCADHIRTTSGNSKVLIVDNTPENRQKYWSNAGGR